MESENPSGLQNGGGQGPHEDSIPGEKRPLDGTIDDVDGQERPAKRTRSDDGLMIPEPEPREKKPGVALIKRE